MALNKKLPCKVCGAKTPVVFNIDFKATPICEDCGTAIFLQQAQWFASESKNLYSICLDKVKNKK